MPFNKGKFTNKSTQTMHHNPSMGEKEKSAPNPHEKDAQAPHGDQGKPPEHVTKTHPGETQPHPETGVHAVHVHHTGGGKAMTHHHHEDGTVESKPHESMQEAHQSAQESLPSDHMGGDQNMDQGGEDYSEVLGGVGGGSNYE